MPLLLTAVFDAKDPVPEVDEFMLLLLLVTVPPLLLEPCPLDALADVVATPFAPACP